MFDKHNTYTRLTYILLALSSLAGIVILWAFVPAPGSEQPVLGWVMLSLLTLVWMLNSYFAYHIYHKNTRTLRWTLWLYALQIFSIEYDGWLFSVNMGLQVSISATYQALSVSVNFMALVIMFVCYQGLRQLRNPPPPLNKTQASPL